MTNDSKAQIKYFCDCPGYGWSIGYIDTLYEYGIIKGTQEVTSKSVRGMFNPIATITRAEFATMLSRLIQKEKTADDEITNGILDLSDGEYYTEPILILSAIGIYELDDDKEDNE